MAQPNRTISKSEVNALQATAREDVLSILGRLADTAKATQGIFPSGIELITVTVKAGPGIEFTVVIAGKDAPKIQPAASLAE